MILVSFLKYQTRPRSSILSENSFDFLNAVFGTDGRHGTMSLDTKDISTFVQSSSMNRNVLLTIVLHFMLRFKCCNKALS